MIVSKFAHVQTCVSLPVKASMLQNADTNRTASARARPRSGGGPTEADPPLRTPETSTLDVSPGLLPLRVVHAVALAVAAVLLRRLPELDRIEIGRRCVRVVLRARALGQLVHDLARLRVRRRLAEVDRLLSLHLRCRHPLDP